MDSMENQLPRKLDKLDKSTREKISKSMLGNKNSLGYHHSESTLQLKSKINKGKVVYSNGERNIFLMIGQEIPEGFVKGVCITQEDMEGRRQRMKELNRKKWEAWREEHGKDQDS